MMEANPASTVPWVFLALDDEQHPKFNSSPL
jgi:hypothetical protein